MIRKSTYRTVVLDSCRRASLRPRRAPVLAVHPFLKIINFGQVLLVFLQPVCCNGGYLVSHCLQGFGMHFLTFWGKWHGDRSIWSRFSKGLSDFQWVYSFAKSQPQKCNSTNEFKGISKKSEEVQSATQNPCKHNAFPMISGPFWASGSGNPP